MSKHWSERALALPENSVKAIAMFAILGCIIFLEVTGKPVSEVIKGLAYVSVGFYFGKGKQQNQEENVEK